MTIHIFLVNSRKQQAIELDSSCDDRSLLEVLNIISEQHDWSLSDVTIRYLTNYEQIYTRLRCTEIITC